MITPAQAAQLNGDSRQTEQYFKDLSDRLEGVQCSNCSNKVWKMADLDMCFSCVTGETDASNDYEIE